MAPFFSGGGSASLPLVKSLHRSHLRTPCAMGCLRSLSSSTTPISQKKATRTAAAPNAGNATHPATDARDSSSAAAAAAAIETTHDDDAAPPTSSSSSSSTAAPTASRTLDEETMQVVRQRLHTMTNRCLDGPTWGLLSFLHSAGHHVYLVGGTVRDLAVGRTPKDIDVLTSASLDQVQRLFHRKSSQTGLTTGDGKSTIIPLIIGKRHPIVQVWRQTKGQGDSTDGTGKVREHLMDVSSFYTDAGVDEVPGFDDESVTTTPEQGYPCPPASNDAGWAKARAANAKRRDFTANALLYDPFKNELFDDVGGAYDLLVRRELRPVSGSAATCLFEDPARMLRAMRFASRTGLRISLGLHHVIASNVNKLANRLATPRFSHELHIMLAYGHSERALDLMMAYGLTNNVVPMLDKSVRTCEALALKRADMARGRMDVSELSDDDLPSWRQMRQISLGKLGNQHKDALMHDPTDNSTEMLQRRIEMLDSEADALAYKLELLEKDDHTSLARMWHVSPDSVEKAMRLSFARRVLQTLDAGCDIRSPCSPVEWLVALTAPVVLAQLHHAAAIFPRAAAAAASRRAIVSVSENPSTATLDSLAAERSYFDALNKLSNRLDVRALDRLLTSETGRRKLRMAQRGNPEALHHVVEQLYASVLSFTFMQLGKNGPVTTNNRMMRQAHRIFSEFGSLFAETASSDAPDLGALALDTARRACAPGNVAPSKLMLTYRCLDMLNRSLFSQEIASVSREVKRLLSLDADAV
ncbi:hypothetical protein PPROV_000845400 [Pycnococcus provasolii]|uniref:Poly A polymerase head domain-containing protein n=2 Tax=Pycnococcus provasolii TaxID=41880 RepID=A0A830HXT0_9CHLO|nr:hypothetical protein PPROV_000845400 [Pycnococcus provasolii]